MTSNEIIQAIKAKIERIKESYDVYLARVTKEDFLNELDAFLDFLSTLESEKLIYSFDELDHEADDWIGVLRSDSGANNDWNIGDIYRTAQHFVQWGADHIKK